MKKKIKFIEIIRLEGLMTHDMELQTFKSFKECDHWLRKNESTFEVEGVSRHNFAIEWEDGTVFEGRLKCTNPKAPDHDDSDNSVRLNIWNHVKKWVEETEKIEMDEDAKEKYLVYYKNLYYNCEIQEAE
jgi:hypothetical protein